MKELKREVPKKEVWEDIPGYEGIYQVSTMGRVRSLDRIVRHSLYGKQPVKGVVLKPGIKKSGYAMVNLSKNNKTKSFFVHLLVARTFIGNIKPGEQVIHLESVKINGDNSLGNIRVASPSCNAAFKYDDKTLLYGEKHPNAKLKESDVIEIIRLLKNKSKTQPEIAKTFGVCRGTICAISMKRRWAYLPR